MLIRYDMLQEAATMIFQEETTMKRAAVILLILVLCLSVAACGDQGVPAKNAPKPDSSAQRASTPVSSPAMPEQTAPSAAVTAFFEAFADADYETMKTYCTDDCVEDNFCADSVYGMQTAKLTSIGAEALSHDGDDCDIPVTVALTPTANSRFAGQTQATFFVELELEHGVWLIDEFDHAK